MVHPSLYFQLFFAYFVMLLRFKTQNRDPNRGNAPLFSLSLIFLFTFGSWIIAVSSTSCVSHQTVHILSNFQSLQNWRICSGTHVLRRLLPHHICKGFQAYAKTLSIYVSAFFASYLVYNDFSIPQSRLLLSLLASAQNFGMSALYTPTSSADCVSHQVFSAWG